MSPKRSRPTEVRREGITFLRQALHSFTAAERRHRRRYGRVEGVMPLGHLRVLYFLLTKSEATAGELAREAELQPGSTTAMLDNLEADGLIRRRRDAVDRRVCWISLTELGRAEAAEKEATWSRTLADFLADTSEADLVTAGQVFEKLAALFDSFASS